MFPLFLAGTNPFLILCMLWDTFLKNAQELSGSLVALSLRPLLWLGPGLESWRPSIGRCIPIGAAARVKHVHHGRRRSDACPKMTGKACRRANFEKSTTIIELVESLADESLSLNERRQLRDEYRSRYGVSQRTIRNYIAATGRADHRPSSWGGVCTPSPRIHDKQLAQAILSLIKERPQRTVAHDQEASRCGYTLLAQAVEKIIDRSVYRFLN